MAPNPCGVVVLSTPLYTRPPTPSAVSCGVPTWGARREEGAVIEQDVGGNLAQYPIEVAWW